MADKTISNPGGVYGYTDLATKGWQQSFPAIASAAITGPAVVALASDLTVATAATDAVAGLCRGIVTNSVAEDGVATVVCRGVAENVPVDGATTAGVVLKRSVTTAGRLAATATPATGEAFAISLAASSSNTTDVWVL